MLDIKIAIYEFKEPDTYVLNEKTGRFTGILGDYYQSLYDKFKWNITYIDKNDFKKNATFSSKKFDNDDVFTANLINNQHADFYFRQIQLTGDVLDQKNVRISPIVGYTSMRLLQCIHRKDEINNRDILSGLKEIDFGFWFKLFLTFLLLTLTLVFIYSVKSYHRFYYKTKVSFSRKLNKLIMFLFMYYIRLITKQNDSNRKWNSSLYGVRYLLLLVVIVFTIVLHQLFFYVAFLNLKFSNTSYILRDLDQVLKDPELYPCFLESETVVQSKINNTNSLSYKLYKHRTPVCFLSSVMNNARPRETKPNSNSGTNANALGRLLTNVLIGSDSFVEYFGYLFCNNYSEFIRNLLGQMLNKKLDKNLPLFWNPSFRSEENLQAFFICSKSPKQVQDAIYYKFVYWTYEHGWIWFLSYSKHKIDHNEFGTCFTSDSSRVSFPYRFSELNEVNFSIINKIALYTYLACLICFIINWLVVFLKQHVQIVLLWESIYR